MTKVVEKAEPSYGCGVAARKGMRYIAVFYIVDYLIHSDSRSSSESL